MAKSVRRLENMKFGRLTALYYAGSGRWRCRCECGGATTVRTNNLLKGNSTSCGCKRVESLFRHGMSKTPLHAAWRMMLQRCENPRDRSFKNYGRRGIKVCERWHKFENFLADMGMRPAGYELDRKDNDGDYEPGNCLWTTKKKNLNNKRTNHMVTWRGETLPITAWAERLWMHPRTLFNRLSRGWSIEKAFTKATQIRKSR